jgi:TonB family protein
MPSKLVAVGVALVVITGGLAAQSVQPQQVYRPGSGVTDPKLVSQVPPKYTPGALRAGLEGVVELEAVVLPDGVVGDVRVVKSLDSQFGLDEQAVAAVRQWRFEPGRLADRPVPVLVTLVIEFRQHGNRQDPQDDDFTLGAYRAGMPDVFEPKMLRQVAPKYSSAALRARIQGTVVIEAVILEDGTVGRARIKTSLDDRFGLDDAALEAIGQWKFEPGTYQGFPAPVLMTLKLEFRLHESPRN